MSISERLRTFRLEVSTTCESFCEELSTKGFKISTPTIYGYESGSRQPSLSYIKGLIDVYEANPLWLLNGQGEMFMSEDEKNKSKLPNNIDISNLVFIPVINMDLSAGYGSLAEEIEMTKDFVSFGKEWLYKNITANVNDLVIFTVKGDSMDGGNSRIKNGALVIVDTSVKEYRNDGVYAIRINNSIFIKRLQYMPGKLLIKSDNPVYEPFEVDLSKDNFDIIGNIAYVINNISAA